ncbi:MAG TPA: hypothetical protein VE868_02865, partial [Balneolaceae bacterium]|nr:hypothetical protein [Balneolaceae bacterium]
PQENANRTGVRWAAWTDDAGNGLLVAGEPTLSVSAWPYSLQDLEQATHTDDLPQEPNITVNLNDKQQGVGGIDSWSRHARPLPQYRLKTSHPYQYQFYLMPYHKTSTPISRIARKVLPDNDQ